MSTAHKLNDWSVVKTRFLEDSERPFASQSRQVPFVIEAKDFTDVKSLQNFLESHGAEVLAAMHEHGALLFRGFAIESEADFESVVLSLRALRGMTGYFMMEKGRHAIQPSENVFSTNSLYKTGGAYMLGGFHSENSSLPDVPGYLAFWCKKPSSLGGETALMHSPSIYQKIAAPLRSKLESKRFFARSFTLKEVAEFYAVTEEQMETFLRDQGQTVVDTPKGKELHIFKPGVTKHPVTGRLSLQGQLSAQIFGLDHHIRLNLVKNYRGVQWLAHRLFWSAEFFVNRILHGWFWLQNKTASIGTDENLGGEFSKAEVSELGRAIAEHTSVFTWKAQDLVLIDNLQLLHNGMPGRGDRELRVMICNPLAIEFPIKAGIDTPETNDWTYKTLWQRWTERK